MNTMGCAWRTSGTFGRLRYSARTALRAHAALAIAIDEDLRPVLTGANFVRASAFNRSLRSRPSWRLCRWDIC